MAMCGVGVQQPDGRIYLAIDPTATDLSTCEYIVDNASSNAWRELGSLTLPQSQLIGLAIAAVWVTAWTFKTIGNSVSTSIESDT